MLSNVVDPIHTDNIPELASGVGLTVISTVREQPKLLVYLINVLPDAKPVTTLVLDIVATEVLVLLQVPPVVLELSNVVPSTHILRLPVIAEGTGLTVTK